MTETFTEEERLELAFGEKTDFNKVTFLTQYANFGVTKLAETGGEYFVGIYGEYQEFSGFHS